MSIKKEDRFMKIGKNGKNQVIEVLRVEGDAVVCESYFNLGIELNIPISALNDAALYKSIL
jgi:hypothetical protein